jgi:acetyl esterase/lipase
MRKWLLASLACVNLVCPALTPVAAQSPAQQLRPGSAKLNAADAPAGSRGSVNPQPHLLDTHGVTRKWLDVAYATGSPAQKLDIYLPNEGEGPFPVIFAVHGGGFLMGDKSSPQVQPEMDGLTRGYAVVCANYRLSGEAIFPAAVLDLKAALRFLRANAARFDLNPDKIAAWGDSAGGNLVSMLGATAGVTALEDLTMGNAGQSSNVQAVVDFYGPTDFANMDNAFLSSGITRHMIHSSPNSYESRYMGFPIASDPEKARKADPETYVSSNAPPFFVENGDKDTTVPPSQSAGLAAALEKAIGKDKVVYVVLPGAGHGGPAFETTENLDKVFAFLDKFIK